MNKRVNIYPRGPITTVNPPIRVPVKNVTKDIKDIRRCIIAGAKVEEITKDGIVVLNLQNYDLNNGEAAEEKPTYVDSMKSPIRVTSESGKKTMDDAKKFKDDEAHIEKIMKIHGEDMRAIEKREEELREAHVEDENEPIEGVIIDDELLNSTADTNVTETVNDTDTNVAETANDVTTPKDTYVSKRQRRKALRAAEKLKKATESAEVIETEDPEKDAENS
jgi:hypothetical protein